MPCLCGSQKRSAAPSTINPVNIGSLCFLFGVQGALCGFLDLIPETIKAVLSVNKKPDDADEIFFKWVRKAAKKGLNIVIDEATGDIDVSSFCSNPPPPLPEEINFSDIFIFMAEVVPILDYWFTASDILSGNSTRLIDKVTAYWLFKQWYENCECKKCPPPDPEDNPPPPPDNSKPNYIIPPCLPCPDGYVDGGGGGNNNRCKNLTVLQSINSSNSKRTCHGFWVYTFIDNGFYGDGVGRVNTTSTAKFYIPLEDDIFPSINKFEEFQQLNNKGILFFYDDYRKAVTPSETPDFINFTDTNEDRTITTFGDGTIYQETTIHHAVISQNGGAFAPFSGNSDGYLYPPCVPCLPPPPPKPFCDLYPNHPDCYEPPSTEDPDNENCDHENIVVGEFTACGNLRSPKSMELIINGDLYDVAVTERETCESVRALKVVQYLECTSPPPPPPPDPCDGVDCGFTAGTVYDLLRNAVFYGYTFYTNQDALDYLPDVLDSTSLTCCMQQVNEGIDNFFVDNPPPNPYPSEGE